MRFLRGLVALIIAGLVVKYGKEPWWVFGLAPLLNSLSKYVRDKWGLDLQII